MRDRFGGNIRGGGGIASLGFLLSVVELTPPSKYHHQEGKNAACVTGINVDSVSEAASERTEKGERRLNNILRSAVSAAGLELWVGHACVSWLSLYQSTNCGSH